MICVSVGRARHKHMIAEYKHLAEEGYPLVELRLDFIKSNVDIARLLKERPGPVLATVRRKEDGGRFNGTEEERQTILRTAIVTGVEYVDLEEDIAGSIPRFGATKRVISLHDFEKTPDDLEAIHARMCELDPDVVKICTMANSTDDVTRMFRMLEKVKGVVPTIGLCMGEIGVPTRILAGKYGAPWTYTSYSVDRKMAPGQVHCKEMRDLYRYGQINEETEVFAVIADPVGHSLSPLIHNAAFKKLDMNRVYVPVRVPPEDLPKFMNYAPEWGIKGISVTIPHKEEVIAKLTQADPAVADIGACNTVVFDGMERLGYNTDCNAAIMSIETAMGGAQEGASPIAGNTALILGAGGVGKAIAYGLIEKGAKVVLTDIDGQRAIDLADRLNCDSCEWTMREGLRCDILVNCTPVGMHPEVNDSPFQKEHMHTDMVVFDAVYNPENTLFIKYAKEKGCVVVTGVDMFVLQAALQFRLFTGSPAPGPLMREVLKQATSAAKY